MVGSRMGIPGASMPKPWRMEFSTRGCRMVFRIRCWFNPGPIWYIKMMDWPKRWFMSFM